MENVNETVRASESDDVRQEIAQMRESMELARSDIRRAKNDVRQFQTEHESHVRRTRALWVLVILLVAGFLAFSRYGWPLLSQRGLLDKIPALQTAMDSMSTNLTAAEQQVGVWAKDRLDFSSRMSEIETNLVPHMKTVRNETRVLSQGLQMLTQQFKRDVEQGVKSLQNRVGGIESIQREHADEVSRLRNELAGIKQELSSVREENVTQTTHIGQIEQAQQSARNDLSSVDRKASVSQSTVNHLSSQVDRQGISFTLPTGRTQLVADGIYLTVNRPNVERQQVDGWVQIARDGRIVWLRGASAQQPIEFTSQSDPRTYQLVFTKIGKNDTVGYLLTPTARDAGPTPSGR